jgi:hypothetical protein
MHDWLRASFLRLWFRQPAFDQVAYEGLSEKT